MEEARPPEPSAEPEDDAPRLPPPAGGKPRRLFGLFSGRDTRKFGERLRVVGPAVQLAPKPANQPRRRASVAWRVFFGLLKTVLGIGTLGAVAAAGLVARARF